MSNRSFLIDTLETRQLFSGHGGVVLHSHHATVSSAVDVTIAADKTAVQTDRQHLNTDRKTFNALLVADAKAYREAVKALADQLKPLQTKMDDDAAENAKASKSGATALAALYAHYSPVLTADKQAVDDASTDADKTDAETQLATDKAAFEAGFGQIHHAALLRHNLFKSDRKAISELITNDPACAAALKQYLADADTRSTTLQADMTKLQADTKQLKLDLAAHAASDTTTET